MPIVNVTWGAKVDANVKKDFFEDVADLINEKTGTSKHLIYVFINEIDEENSRQPGPVAIIDWTKQDARSPEAKNAIQEVLADKLSSITGLKKEETVVIFNDIPLDSAGVGGVVRYKGLNLPKPE
ncbi:MAG: tautomerase family protein [Firmicutes bacterium]|nr:tautomerase family protein [Bacillota bacterium]